MASKKMAPLKVDGRQIQLMRSGKVDGRLPEVRRGAGPWEDKRFKDPKHRTKGWDD